MPELTSFFANSFWIGTVTVILSVFFLWLFIIQGRNYSVHDTEAHAEEFGDLIKEGHGGMTMFLWVSFAAIFVWMIYYFAINWRQFLVLFIYQR